MISYHYYNASWLPNVEKKLLCKSCSYSTSEALVSLSYYAGILGLAWLFCDHIEQVLVLFSFWISSIREYILFCLYELPDLNIYVYISAFAHGSCCLCIPSLERSLWDYTLAFAFFFSFWLSFNMPTKCLNFCGKCFLIKFLRLCEKIEQQRQQEVPGKKIY